MKCGIKKYFGISVDGRDRCRGGVAERAGRARLARPTTGAPRRDARRNPIKTAWGPTRVPLHEILKIQLRFSLF